MSRLKITLLLNYSLTNYIYIYICVCVCVCVCVWLGSSLLFKRV